MRLHTISCGIAGIIGGSWADYLADQISFPYFYENFDFDYEGSRVNPRQEFTGGNILYRADDFDYYFHRDDNARYVQHRYLLDRYGIKGGWGDFCIELSNPDESPFVLGASMYCDEMEDTPYYIKFDFCHTSGSYGDLITMTRQKDRFGAPVSDDMILTLTKAGNLKVTGTQHVVLSDDPDNPCTPMSWMGHWLKSRGTRILIPNKWHEIQLYIVPTWGPNTSFKGPACPPNSATTIDNVLVQAWMQYEKLGKFDWINAEGWDDYHLLRFAEPGGCWPVQMLPGQEWQSDFPPTEDHYASGQFFYPRNHGMVWVWIDGQIDIIAEMNIHNAMTPWVYYAGDRFLIFGDNIKGESNDVGYSPYDNSDPHFFIDNIIMQNGREGASLPSDTFNPPYFTGNKTWSPNYPLKFQAVMMDENYYVPTDDGGCENVHEKHPSIYNKLIPSGEPFYVPAPDRTGAPTNNMIPHGTKLTPVPLDFNGNQNDYINHNTSFNDENTINSWWYPFCANNLNFQYEFLKSDPRIPFNHWQSPPGIKSETVGDISLFYLKRPISASGISPLAGRYGYGGIKDYLPPLAPEFKDTLLPEIYRVWLCAEDKHTGTDTPLNHQHFVLRVPDPSEPSGYSDFVSTWWMPGDYGHVLYNGQATLSNGYSICEWPYNPVTGSGWSWSDLDTIQVGVKHLSGSNNDVYVFRYFVVIEHASPLDPTKGALNVNLLKNAIADDSTVDSFYNLDTSLHGRGPAMVSPYLSIPVNIYESMQTAILPGDRSLSNNWVVNPPPAMGIERRDIDDIELNEHSTTIKNPRIIDDGAIEIRGIGNNVTYVEPVWIIEYDSLENILGAGDIVNGDIIIDSNNNYYEAIVHSEEGLAEWETFIGTEVDHGDNYFYAKTWDTTARPNNDRDPEDFDKYTDWFACPKVHLFNSLPDPDSFFHCYSPSAVAIANTQYPDLNLNENLPTAMSGQSFYFQAPALASGSVYQTIDLLREGFLSEAIDRELYEVNMGFWQTSLENDQGRGIFIFFGSDGSQIYAKDFGLDSETTWHNQDITTTLCSGVRFIVFSFEALRQFDREKRPGGRMGGTNNFASFDQAYVIISFLETVAASKYHPADIDENYRISTIELGNYIMQWQSGMLGSGLGCQLSFLRKAEDIWMFDPNGGYDDSGDASRPFNWNASGTYNPYL